MIVLKTLFKWIVLPILALLIIISLGLVVTGNAYIFRGIQLTYLKGENTANIDDYIDFDNRTIRAKDTIKWNKDAFRASLVFTIFLFTFQPSLLPVIRILPIPLNNIINTLII